MSHVAIAAGWTIVMLDVLSRVSSASAETAVAGTATVVPAAVVAVPERMPETVSWRVVGSTAMCVTESVPTKEPPSESAPPTARFFGSGVAARSASAEAPLAYRSARPTFVRLSGRSRLR